MLVDVMTFASYFSIAKKEINDLRGPHLFIDQGRAFDTGDSGHSAPLLEDLELRSTYYRGKFQCSSILVTSAA